MSKKIKISDLVINKLVTYGIDTVFGVTGGAVVHFFDSISKNKKISSVFMNHEQAASFALESYAKSRNTFGAGIFTTGPGSTNALTGLAAAWLDSIPAIFISGQARSNLTVNGRPLRQIGTQEIDIVSIVKPITKYAVTVRSAKDVSYEIDKGIFLAKSQRPGPVWIDIPVDISWSFIDESALKIYKTPTNNNDSTLDKKIIKDLAKQLLESERPIILVGYGCRLSSSEKKLLKLIKKYQIPFLTSWNMCDFTEFQHPLNVGRPGISGQRGANLAVQNSDLLLSLGSHLNNSITGTSFSSFAPDAKVAIVDIDKNELDNLNINVEFKIQANVKDFLEIFSHNLANLPLRNQTKAKNWQNTIHKYKNLNEIASNFKNQKKYVNSFYLKSLISKYSKEDAVFVIDGGGTNVYSSYQSLINKKNQKLLLSTGLCSMGSGIPEAIGAHYADKNKEIFCFVGDGSFPFNMQELQLIKNLQLPIKIFVFNNDGYTSIKTTQKEFLSSNYIGSDKHGGVHFLEVEKSAKNFGLKYFSLKSHDDTHKNLKKILKSKAPFICEVYMSKDEEIQPRQGFKKNEDGSFSPRPLEDMYPFLPRKLFNSLMVRNENLKDIKHPNIGREINLLERYPQSRRLFDERGKRKLSGKGYISIRKKQSNDEIVFDQLLLKKAREFGKAYFDGDRLYGYGGYKYNKKYWYKVAEDIVKYYKLNNSSSVLDVGCAKGFLLHDLKLILPNLKVAGIDISSYAIKTSVKSIKKDLQIANANKIPFKDNTFDLVLSINALSELNIIDCRRALKEIERVKKKDSFITVNSWDNQIQKTNFYKWNVTGMTNKSKKEWLKIFKEENYSGDFYWFIAD